MNSNSDENKNSSSGGSPESKQATHSSVDNSSADNSSADKSPAESSPFTIWVDADACPVAIKEIIFRTAKRLEIAVVLVANGGMQVPKSSLIQLMTVSHGADIADDRIVELMKPTDLVITADVPLAARVVKKGSTAIGPRGQLYDDDTVHARLASRNIGEQLRSAGLTTSGPKPLGPKDVQAFANLLDRIVTRMLKRKK
jgi:uncharacterized protein YaiI (UPF0178 family)